MSCIKEAATRGAVLSHVPHKLLPNVPKILCGFVRIKLLNPDVMFPYVSQGIIIENDFLFKCK